MSVLICPDCKAEVVIDEQNDAGMCPFCSAWVSRHVPHDQRCCREHGTHSMPHVGCILR